MKIPSHQSDDLGTDTEYAIARTIESLRTSTRPVILLGGGIERRGSLWHEQLELTGIPVMTTYNGADRVGSEMKNYFGRPNTWGMRYSNALLGQADLIVAIGTRLGLQQTGFNSTAFAPVGKIIQVDIDEHELKKGHPDIASGFLVDATRFLERLLESIIWIDHVGWVNHCVMVRELLPLSDRSNSAHPGFWNPYDFLNWLSRVATHDDVVIPCSSGGAFTTFYQAFQQKAGQIIVSNKSLASMGYGLAGALGASIAHPGRRVLHVEGDGGFSQNLQELATVKVRNPNLKMFDLCNDGYASIRMTQRNYFEGQYLGCDDNTGLGFPDWSELAHSYSLRFAELPVSQPDTILKLLESPEPALISVPIHPEQTYYPKISSQITAEGSMESEPLWAISPRLHESLAIKVYRFMPSHLLDYYLGRTVGDPK